MRSRWRSVLARMRPPLRPAGQAADRLAILLLAVVAFKFSDWLWLSSRISGRPALLANLLIQCLAFAVFCVLLALACRRPLPSWLSRIRLHRLFWYSPVLLVPVVLAVGIGVGRPIAEGRVQLDDANAMAVCGARAILSGHDPYQVAEIPCLDSFHLSPTLATPLQVGPLASVKVYPTTAQILAAAHSQGHGGQALFSPLSKPPLTPAVMVPVAHAPVWVRAAWTLLPVLLLLLVFAFAAGPLWPAATGIALLTFFLNGLALNFAANGNAESFAYCLMALAVLWVRRPWVSAVCLGLAVASNQLAWPFVLGCGLLCLDLGGWAKRAGGFLITLVVCLLPWLLVYPAAARTVLGTLTAPTFPLGSGLVELGLGHFSALPSRSVLLDAAGLAIILIGLWGVWSRTWRVSAAVLASLWLSWRSLDEYLAQIPLLALAALLVMAQGPLRQAGNARTLGVSPTGEFSSPPLEPGQTLHLRAGLRRVPCHAPIPAGRQRQSDWQALACRWQEVRGEMSSIQRAYSDLTVGIFGCRLRRS